MSSSPGWIFGKYNWLKLGFWRLFPKNVGRAARTRPISPVTTVLWIPIDECDSGQFVTVSERCAADVGGASTGFIVRLAPIRSLV